MAFASSSSSISLDKSSETSESLRKKRILSSKLYFDVPLSKVPMIYSPSYNIAFLGIEKLHPFDSSKWGRICQFLIKEGVLDKKWIIEPLEASPDDLLVVHSESYLDSLKTSVNVAAIIEVPPVAFLPSCLVEQKVLRPFRKQVGGSILAAKIAKERGWAINVGGGFHHCSAEKGGGFCAYADITLCIQFAFVQLNISRVMIIDLDAHQGNGHETDFSSDSRVYILDMYNSQIYPFDYEAKRYIDQKVEIVSGTRTKEYLEQLDKALEVARNNFDPELVVYNAGTDILDGDPLGRLKVPLHLAVTKGRVDDARVKPPITIVMCLLDSSLSSVSPDGVADRDEKVFRFAREKNIPLLMLTSGGYMKSSAKVIADSIMNLSKKNLIDLESRHSGR